MFSLTTQERWLILLVLTALVVGAVVRQWRASHRMESAIEAAVAESSSGK